MTPELAIELIKGLVVQAVALATPLLTAAMAVGIAVSLFQAVTSIHEQTLSFVPKALTVSGLLLVLLPWLTRTILDFTQAMFQKLPEMVR
jgi:flagellar biosynthetic protein FliQ